MSEGSDSVFDMDSGMCYRYSSRWAEFREASKKSVAEKGCGRWMIRLQVDALLAELLDQIYLLDSGGFLWCLELCLDLFWSFGVFF